MLADQVRRNDGNNAVPEPVGGGRETDTTGADGQREDLANDDPCSWTPGSREEEDVDADEGDLGVDSCGVRCDFGAIGKDCALVESSGDTNDGNNVLADEHASSTPDEDCAATKLLNDVEGDRSGADVDQSEDEGDEEDIRDVGGLLEESGGVVEDEVDTAVDRISLPSRGDE